MFIGRLAVGPPREPSQDRGRSPTRKAERWLRMNVVCKLAQVRESPTSGAAHASSLKKCLWFVKWMAADATPGFGGWRGHRAHSTGTGTGTALRGPGRRRQPSVPSPPSSRADRPGCYGLRQRRLKPSRTRAARQFLLGIVGLSLWSPAPMSICGGRGQRADLDN